MSGDFGATYDRKPLVLQTPTRYMKGEKQRNPILDYVPDWALFKAPTTSDHRFSTYNHNWTLGDVYGGKYPICYSGCRQCAVSCRNSEASREARTTKIHGMR